MEEPKQLSVSELRKKFESKSSTSSTPSTTTKPIQSTTTQPPRQGFPGNSQPNVSTDNNKAAASEPETANLSVKERMKMFDKSKNQQETQPVPLQPKKTHIPPQATVNSENIETNNVSAEPEKLIVSETEPIQEPIQQEEVHQEPEQTQEIQQEEIPQESTQQEEIPQEPIQQEEVHQEPEQVQETTQQEEIPQESIQQDEVHQEPEQVQEIQQEEIAPQVVAEEFVPEVQEEKVQEVVEEIQEPIKEPETVQEKIQEVQESIEEPEVVQEKHEEQVPVVVEQEETKDEGTKNPVLNRNAGFASEMNAMLAKKGLGSNEDSPIKPEQSKNQGLPSEDAYTEALLTRPTSDPRKKKGKLVFVDDEDF